MGRCGGGGGGCEDQGDGGSTSGICHCKKFVNGRRRINACAASRRRKRLYDARERLKKRLCDVSEMPRILVDAKVIPLMDGLTFPPSGYQDGVWAGGLSYTPSFVWAG